MSVKLYKTFLLAAVCCALSLTGFSQRPHASLWAGGAFVHTQGFGIKAQRHFASSSGKPVIIGLEAYSLKPRKQERVINPIYEGATPFVPGKQYAPLVLMPSFGARNVLTRAHGSNSFQVGVHYGLGLNVALLKPVYVTVIEDLSTGSTKIVRYQPKEHSFTEIKGGASYFRGFDQLKAVLGIGARASLVFEWEPGQQTLKAVEAGVMMDAFADELPIFAFGDNQRYWGNLYLAFLLGKKQY